jgi:hypothetical protein
MTHTFGRLLVTVHTYVKVILWMLCNEFSRSVDSAAVAHADSRIM